MQRQRHARTDRGAFAGCGQFNVARVPCLPVFVHEGRFAVVDEFDDRHHLRERKQPADVIAVIMRGDGVVDLRDSGVVHHGLDAIRIGVFRSLEA